MKRYFFTLTGRFTLSAFMLHMVMMPLLFGGVLYMVQINYQNHFINQVRNDAFILASFSESLDENALHFQQVITEDAVISGRLLSAQIINSQNKRLRSWGDPIAVSAFNEDFYFGEHGDTVYNIIVPRYDPTGNLLGELLLSYDEQPTREQIAQTYLNGLYLAIGYIAITFTLTLLLGRQVTIPIRQLREASGEITAGHYEKALQVKTSIRDINHLAETLEFMRHELVEKNTEMRYQAMHDHLTGLPNRLLLRHRIDHALADKGHRHQTIALLLIDLDRFKEINDTLGHLTGDEVLKQAAERLLTCIRQSDTAARLGGDEFAIILPSSDSDSAINTAQLVSQRLQEYFTVNDNKLQVGASIGIALYPEHGDHFEEILRCADIAMYASKRDRKGGTTLYKPELDISSDKELLLINELRKAIESDSLYLVYQPKVDAKSGCIYGVETLLRWDHPQHGQISPEEFIPIAENYNIIDDLTYWVCQHAIQQCRHWLEQGLRLSVAINISARCFLENKLLSNLQALLTKYDVPANLVEVEITESAIFHDPLQAAQILHKINEMGINISIDDFGTGYSSLAQLKSIPLSYIKIDRSFIFDMLKNENDATIVRATIKLAHELGLKVTAEGVEDKNTKDTLIQLDCDLLQGYYISPPLPEKEFNQWLKESSLSTVQQTGS